MELKSSWILWQNVNKDTNDKSWGDDLVKVGEVGTVPEFLYLVDEISKIGVNNLSNMKLFSKGIKPMWEDEANINGGRIILDVSMMSRQNIDKIWKNTMAFCVSNEVDNICGCVCNEKSPVYKVSIWVSTDTNHELIQEKWSEKLNIEKSSMYFFLHKRSLDNNRQKKRYSGKR